MPLQHILTKPIDWESVRQQHEQMVKYATALRLGTALRRFTRKKRATPTYKAIAELGKAIKTIFLCQYLHDESLRPEIHDWITWGRIGINQRRVNWFMRLIMFMGVVGVVLRVIFRHKTLNNIDLRLLTEKN